MQDTKTKSSEIKFTVTLDEKNIPQKIVWNASDSAAAEQKECKSIMISLWDPEENNTLRIDLWTKDMRVDEMHIHFLQTMMTIAESYNRATGNPFIMEDMKEFVDSVAKKTADWEKKRQK